MPPKIKLLLTGATGYIGGTILARLIERPDFTNYAITALVRSSEKASKLEAFGFVSVVGSHEDETLVRSLAAEADIVITAADVASVKAAKAILEGLKERYSKTGVASVLIHTSGVGQFADKAAGDNVSDIIFDDANPEQIENLPDSAALRNVDVPLVNADKEGYVKAYIILPSVVYGKASGPLVDQGIQNPYPILIVVLARIALARGRSPVIGKGVNIWNNVHIDDAAELYMSLLDAITKKIPLGHGREGFYVAENGEHTLYEVALAIGTALRDLGKLDSAEPRALDEDELLKYFGIDPVHGSSTYFGTNTRAVGNRSRAIGWQPHHTTADFLASIKRTIEDLLETGRI